MVGVTCMVFDHPVLHAQIERDSMVFSTMGNWHQSGKLLFAVICCCIASDII